jgi:hypothetical protein
MGEEIEDALGFNIQNELKIKDHSDGITEYLGPCRSMQ